MYRAPCGRLPTGEKLFRCHCSLLRPGEPHHGPPNHSPVLFSEASISAKAARASGANSHPPARMALIAFQTRQAFLLPIYLPGLNIFHAVFQLVQLALLLDEVWLQQIAGRSTPHGYPSRAAPLPSPAPGWRDSDLPAAALPPEDVATAHRDHPGVGRTADSLLNPSFSS